MQRLDSRFLEQLAEKLKTLIPPGKADDRSNSWMTAPQIASWWSETGAEAPSELDARLLEGWEDDERFSALGIRPAKYPSFDLLRMWGHEGRVGRRRREQIGQRRMTRPVRLTPPLRCAADAELVFLSYSFLDRKFALRLRLALAELGLRPWVAEEAIEENEPIFESVRSALQRSTATIVALGRNALGSAWVHTESVGSGVKIFVCDGTDEALMQLLASWRPPEGQQDINYDPALLVPLVEAYRQVWDKSQPAQETLVESVGGESIRMQRPDKFAVTAKELLFALDVCQPCIYPSRPPNWRGRPELQNFDSRLSCLSAKMS